MNDVMKSNRAKNQTKRIARKYPAWTFEQSLPLARAIQEHASGEKVNRLTLFRALNKSPTSSSSQLLITNSTKYDLTKGSFVAEYLELTDAGRKITSPQTSEIAKLSLFLSNAQSIGSRRLKLVTIRTGVRNCLRMLFSPIHYTKLMQMF